MQGFVEIYFYLPPLSFAEFWCWMGCWFMAIVLGPIHKFSARNCLFYQCGFARFHCFMVLYLLNPFLHLTFDGVQLSPRAIMFQFKLIKPIKGKLLKIWEIIQESVQRGRCLDGMWCELVNSNLKTHRHEVFENSMINGQRHNDKVKTIL